MSRRTGWAYMCSDTHIAKGVATTRSARTHAHKHTHTHTHTHKCMQRHPPHTHTRAQPPSPSPPTPCRHAPPACVCRRSAARTDSSRCPECGPPPVERQLRPCKRSRRRKPGTLPHHRPGFWALRRPASPSSAGNRLPSGRGALPKCPGSAFGKAARRPCHRCWPGRWDARC